MSGATRDSRLVFIADCGGSFTRISIADASGRVIAKAKGGSSNASDYGLQASFSVVNNTLIQALTALDLPISPWPFSKALLAMSGCDSAEAEQRIRTFACDFWNIQNDTSIQVMNDSSLLATGISLPPHQEINTGVCLISGTGSVTAAYQVSPSNVTLLGRAGGYGHLLGDEGSGFYIGKQLLRFLLHLSEREPEKIRKGWRLLDTTLQYFHITSIDQLLPAVYLEKEAHQIDRKVKIAGLARLVQACAFPAESRWPAEGATAFEGPVDSDALLILKDAALQLALMVKELVDRKVVQPSSSTLVFGSGVLASESFRTLVLRAMQLNGMVWRATEYMEEAGSAACVLLASGFD